MAYYRSFKYSGQYINTSIFNLSSKDSVRFRPVLDVTLKDIDLLLEKLERLFTKV
ncbi:MAG TPA: hypothetical protein VI754_12685 [Bacteriovoracaceae bacterium]|nr:hypothetical protein [Bacteriovoracaceae bacterium]